MKQIFNYPLILLGDFFESLGQYVLLMVKLFRSIESWKNYLPNTIDQLMIIGSKSIPIVIITIAIPKLPEYLNK